MYKCIFGDDTAKARCKEALPAAATRDSWMELSVRLGERLLLPGLFFFSCYGPSLSDLVVYDNITTNPFPGSDAVGFDRSGYYPKINALVDAVKKLNDAQS
jgi:hypothetical protein